MKSILLAILPALTVAHIRVDIIPATKYSKATVNLTGSERASAADIDLTAFYLTKNKIKSSLDRLNYTRVDFINVNHASSNGGRDLYVNLKPVTSKIIKSYERPVKIGKKELQNDGCCLAPIKVDMNHVIRETLQGKWYETQDLSVGRNIEVNFSSDRLSCTSTWGQDDYEIKMKQIATITEVSTPLEAKQTATAVINVMKTSLELRIDYEATLDGDMYFEYTCPKYLILKDRHKKVFDINEYFHRLDYQGVMKAYQVLTVNYYSNARVQVTDDQDGKVLLNKEALIREY